MENIDRLELANQTLINVFLEDNYVILNNTFVNKHTMTSEWGYGIIEHLEPILSLKEDYIEHVVKSWVHSKGMFDDKWENSYLPTVLKTIHTPSKQIELERLIGMNGEKQMVVMLSEKIAKEIDSEILRLLKKKVNNFEEFENLMKCLGYKLSKRYTLTTTHSYHTFVSTTEYDKINEQQNNPYWKDWFRARGPNQKT